MKFATFILKKNLLISVSSIKHCLQYALNGIYFCFREFLGQAWMKTDKATKAPHIILMTKRFNEVSILLFYPQLQNTVITEIP
jgi:hypothetical protein